MSDIRKTLLFAAAAGLLVLLAAVTTPRERAAEIFNDQGQPFFAEFTDPLAATSLEVVEFDEATGTVHPFKVELKGGLWSIPSHHNYPADAADRLKKTAGAVIDLRKDAIRSDNPKDHEAFGVIDPLDETANGLKGRGKRVTLRDKDGKTLADFIFGKETQEGSGQRYVRAPGQKRTYAVKTQVEISSKFEDWIETDLLKVAAWTIRKMTIDSYSVDEQRGQILDRAVYQLSRGDSSSPWSLEGLDEKEEVNSDTVTKMLNAIDDLRIVGVRPKPDFMTKDLKQSDKIKPTPQAAFLLQQKGFYFLGDGTLVSNEGELQIACEDGVVYRLGFGEVLVGAGEEVTAGKEEAAEAAPEEKKKEEEKKGGTENRYLLVTVRFDESAFGPAPAEPVAPEGYKPGEEATKAVDASQTVEVQPDAKKPDAAAVEQYKKDKAEYDKKKAERDQKIGDGRKRIEELNLRFADWYYVISQDSFKSLRHTRGDLVKPKEPPKDKPEEKK